MCGASNQDITLHLDQLEETPWVNIFTANFDRVTGCMYEFDGSNGAIIISFCEKLQACASAKKRL